MRRSVIFALLTCLSAIGIGLAQQGEPGQAKGKGKGKLVAARPPLFLKEEWKQTPAGGEHAVVPAESLANPNLELKLYGTTSKEIQLTGAATDETNPIHLWTGLCTTPCGFALRDKTGYADLTGLGRIRVVTKMSGFHQVRLALKLADGTWLVGDRGEGSTVDWLETEFSISEQRWVRMDPERVVTTGAFVANPDLSKVDEIGFVDLMPGSGHGQGGWADVGKIEVYAKRVPRN